MSDVIINDQFVNKLLDFAKAGLNSETVGTKGIKGTMCMESLISYIGGDKAFSYEPECVHLTVSDYGVFLNDSVFSHVIISNLVENGLIEYPMLYDENDELIKFGSVNYVRSVELRKFMVAQLGSVSLGKEVRGINFSEIFYLGINIMIVKLIIELCKELGIFSYDDERLKVIEKLSDVRSYRHEDGNAEVFIDGVNRNKSLISNQLREIDEKFNLKRIEVIKFNGEIAGVSEIRGLKIEDFIYSSLLRVARVLGVSGCSGRSLLLISLLIDNSSLDDKKKLEIELKYRRVIVDNAVYMLQRLGSEGADYLHMVENKNS